MSRVIITLVVGQLRFPRVSGDEPAPARERPIVGGGFPRVSGDEPGSRRPSREYPSFSPRERG